MLRGAKPPIGILISGIHQLMLTLEKVSPMMKDREEDLKFVKKVVQSNDFQSLMHIHSVIKYGSIHTDEPVTKNSVAMSHIVSKQVLAKM